MDFLYYDLKAAVAAGEIIQIDEFTAVVKRLEPEKPEWFDGTFEEYSADLLYIWTEGKFGYPYILDDCN